MSHTLKIFFSAISLSCYKSFQIFIKRQLDVLSFFFLMSFIDFFYSTLMFFLSLLLISHILLYLCHYYQSNQIILFTLVNYCRHTDALLSRSMFNLIFYINMPFMSFIHVSHILSFVLSMHIKNSFLYLFILE